MNARTLQPLWALFLGVAVSLSAGGLSAQETSRPKRDVITAEQIATIQVSSAYEIVQRLRPQFLRERGSVSVRNGGKEGHTLPAAGEPQTGLVVYVNGARAGGVEALRGIPAHGVVEIRRVSARDATTTYGTGHPLGVIEVRTQ